MPLCGSSFCGCALLSVPAESGELDGALPTIDLPGSGTGASPWNLTVNDEWVQALVARLPVALEFSGTTSAGGDLVVSYGVTFATSPIVSAIPVSSGSTQLAVHVVSRTTTAVTLRFTSNNAVVNAGSVGGHLYAVAATP